MDQSFFDNLKGRVDAALATGTNGRKPELVLDLSDVKYVDSRSIGVLLLEADRLTAAGGSFRIVNCAPRVLDLLRLIGVDHFLTVESAAVPRAS